MTRSTRLHVFVQHHQHPGQKQKHRGNNGMPPKHEGHPKGCNDESTQCHPATSKVAFVNTLQQEEDYRDEESLINRALQIARHRRRGLLQLVGAGLMIAVLKRSRFHDRKRPQGVDCAGCLHALVFSGARNIFSGETSITYERARQR
jgi:hypothetical protein